MEPHKKGDLTEAIVIAELKRRNIPVSTPFGDNERYDLLVEATEGDLLRIQVKTGRLVNGTVVFDGLVQHTNTNGNKYEIYDDDVDYFIVYCDTLESLYLVPENEVSTKMHLRVESPEFEHPSINWAEEYEFDRCWPPDDPAEGAHSESDMPPHRRGEATEAQVIAELLRREIPIAIPPTDNERFDLLAGTPDGEFFRIQIKTGWIKDGCIQFRADSVHTNAQENVHKPYDGDIDHFLVYVPSLNESYLITEDAFNTAISLRIGDVKRVHRDTKWAEDYEFDRNWPPATDTSSHPTRRHPRDKIIHNAVINVLRDHDIPIAHSMDGDVSYDLVAETPDGDVVRLAIRTAGLKDGRVFFHPDDDEHEDTAIDQYLLYCYDLDETYLIPTDSFDSSISLWVDEPKEIRRTTRWAEDFELDRRWPPRWGRVISRQSAVGTAAAAFNDLDASVASPVDDDASHDLLVGVPTTDTYHRIAVEPGWVSSGRIRLKPDSTDGIDFFLVHCREHDACYLIDSDEFDASISLRVDLPDHDDGTINWAEAYELERRWPVLSA